MNFLIDIVFSFNLCGDIMEIKVGVSNRHVHLTEEVYKKLFSDFDEIKKLEKLLIIFAEHTEVKEDINSHKK